MKFFAIAALFAAFALAAPAEDTKAVESLTNNESSALKYLLANSPAGHEVAEDGLAPNLCYWDGSAPFCDGACPSGYREANRGSCGDGACCWTGTKALCCRE